MSFAIRNLIYTYNIKSNFIIYEIDSQIYRYFFLVLGDSSSEISSCCVSQDKQNLSFLSVQIVNVHSKACLVRFSIKKNKLG